ncbi:glutamine-hydrolyzing GMP synthase [Desulfuribacillus alkaliarsenatis]|uniref:GMP synthase [glutamine-hydrolyzing] n=1 Tax=Desulfuribacillus alkaliarsenatis TaxID=766136 RepID=A0A1E5G1Z2_9FIRM|nr:glutamine-hydrolyzing GMP synthase [Desulfuribacillus alkaliarsenatis]OEF97008.1 glutamine-hydrolyzing GMP synthase [Desulfuribacillus alkaliarsenatis]
MQKPEQKVIVLDFGGQYNQLIARRIRELGVYSELMSHKTTIEQIKELNPKGIIFSGGPNSVYSEKAPKVDSEIYELGIPILGICYGMQMMSYHFEGKVERASVREYGKATITVSNESSLLYTGLPKEQQVWMSHSDLVIEPPKGFVVDASTNHAPVAAMSNEEKRLYAVQFHPEVLHTVHGNDMLKNFILHVCKCDLNWTASNFVEFAVEDIKSRAGDKKVLCGLSGGVDSSVAAVLTHKAVGDNLTCIFVDHGLLRKNEAEQVMETFKDGFNMNIILVDAKERFMTKLKGVSDPETKRKIIGEEFIRVFEEESKKLGQFDYLVQGTLYTDIIESGTDTATTIKSHHNVGGLPEDIDFEIIEPLNTLFKDEVRRVGEEMGLPETIVWRHPFPGPGLAIRAIGEVTEEKLHILRESDAILTEEVRKAGLYREVWQMFTVVPNVRSVGVMGDERTYNHAVAIRAVTSTDGMTADWAHLPYELLQTLSSRMINEIPEVNRVVYDITSKPPATIEWE